MLRETESPAHTLKHTHLGFDDLDLYPPCMYSVQMSTTANRFLVVYITPKHRFQFPASNNEVLLFVVVMVVVVGLGGVFPPAQSHIEAPVL